MKHSPTVEVSTVEDATSVERARSKMSAAEAQARMPAAAAAHRFCLEQLRLVGGVPGRRGEGVTGDSLVVRKAVCTSARVGLDFRLNGGRFGDDAGKPVGTR